MPMFNDSLMVIDVFNVSSDERVGCVSNLMLDAVVNIGNVLM